MKRMRATGSQIYQLKVTLQDIRPPIWRRFVVPGDIPLKRLHEALQLVMGWTDSHLHQFEARNVLYGSPDRDLKRTNEATTTLDLVLCKPNDRMTYEYDFGDSWIHDVVLEKILPPSREGLFPIMLAGKRACPLEDMGGAPGYARFLDIMANPKHPEHSDMLDWAGGPFDPEAYDVGRANLELHGGWVRRAPDA
jgi:hypothetical protein